MAQRVVDALEVVEVHEQRRHRCLAAHRAGEHLLDAVEDQRAIWQAGERIMGGKEAKLLLTPGQLFVGAPAL